MVGKWPFSSFFFSVCGCFSLLACVWLGVLGCGLGVLGCALGGCCVWLLGY